MLFTAVMAKLNTQSSVSNGASEIILICIFAAQETLFLLFNENYF